jgi:hypothetical protein
MHTSQAWVTVEAYLYDNQCGDCPEYYYAEDIDNTCKACYSTCAVCEGTGEAECTSCRTGYFH